MATDHATPPSDVAGGPSPRAAGLEVAVLVGVVLSYIWLWHGSFRGHAAAIAVLYFGLGIASNLRRREGPHAIGLRADNLPRAMALVLAAVAPFVLGALLGGWALRSWHFPDFTRSTRSLAAGAVWGLAQDYGLLAVLFRRLREVFARRRTAMAAAAFLFALFHLPNPFLTVLTAGFGVLACWLYERGENLVAIAVGHAIVAFALLYALPAWLTWEMRVGPQVLPLLLGHR